MTRIESLLTELKHETQISRRHLERLPDANFDWRPHPKSSIAGQLACHIVECIRWTPSIFSADELDLDKQPYQPVLATCVASLLEAFDAEVDAATRVMVSAADTGASLPWRLKMAGKVWFENPREVVFRDLTLNHLIHHRGQLSVYLRLLDVAVPASYGPTADEQ